MKEPLICADFVSDICADQRAEGSTISGSFTLQTRFIKLMPPAEAGTRTNQ